ncbi:hypothetical protein B484DRAFT_455743, partial [Ochromonadaceae sp. CCMP2298]
MLTFSSFKTRALHLHEPRIRYTTCDCLWCSNNSHSYLHNCLQCFSAQTSGCISSHIV